ncbi:MAG: hypothetical protein P1U90_20685 [Akkermansiaceae bacterium]|nr:hypothetical protein [Akkermansiaceae bacterium]
MNSRPSSKLKPSIWLAIIALPLAVVSSEILVWWWNNPPEPEEGRIVLDYTFPRDCENVTPEPVKDAIRRILSFDDSELGWIEAGEGRRISLNYFEWDHLGDTGLGVALHHSPDVCMGNQGNEVQSFLANRAFDLDGHQLIFDSTQFEGEEGMPLYIFKLVWVEGLEGMNLLRDVDTKERKFKLNSVVERWSPKHARVLMLGVFGTKSDEDAWGLVEREVLPDLTFRTLN